jgi:hypothetical protein
MFVAGDEDLAQDVAVLTVVAAGRLGAEVVEAIGFGLGIGLDGLVALFVELED